LLLYSNVAEFLSCPDVQQLIAACFQPLQLFDHLGGLKDPANEVKQLYSSF
jgi:hypothetical protein